MRAGTTSGYGRASMNTSTSVNQVVIIGGGFAGLFAARALRRAPVQVTLIVRAEHHLFQPLLYQCATGILSEGKIAIPLRDLRHGPVPPRPPRDLGDRGSDVPGQAAWGRRGRHADRAVRRAQDQPPGPGPDLRQAVPLPRPGLGRLHSRGRAVISAGKLHFGGFLGWLAWLFIHIGFLTGYRNRVGAVLGLVVRLQPRPAAGTHVHRRRHAGACRRVRRLRQPCGHKP